MKTKAFSARSLTAILHNTIDTARTLGLPLVRRINCGKQFFAGDLRMQYCDRRCQRSFNRARRTA